MQTPQNTLRQRDFIIVLLGQIISLFGNASCALPCRSISCA